MKFGGTRGTKLISKYFLDRFFQTSSASDSATTHLDHGLIVASTAAITCSSDHVMSHGDETHQIDKHGNLIISPKSEVL